MKKLKIFIIVYVIICVIAVVAMILYSQSYNIVFDTEPVVENDITLKAKEIHDYMRENNYGYCTYDSRCNHDGECGLNSTFEASKTKHHNTCCATYVSWVLQETGYLTAKEHNENYLNGANNLWKYLIKKGWIEVENKNDIKPGDIMCYNGHVAIYGGNGKRYDAGNKSLIQHVAPCKVVSTLGLVKVLRAPIIQ